ncbi:ABC transporter permease [Staphylococcus pettenkoferi]|uniref:ABC transporter permease n=1 Tax=Staphylococcus pettenkoferi TaxID=170573 RepID=UPI0022770540|nr:ABC transporter permease [Staphylococcus pettenkoferi]MCY1614726.1 ABC transporter permease [Staphylococcus pettenkoferi]
MRQLLIYYLKVKKTATIYIMLIPTVLTVALFSLLAIKTNQEDFQIYRVTSLQFFYQYIYPLIITLLVCLNFRIERKNNAFQNTLIYFKNLRTYYLSRLFIFIVVSWQLILLSFVTITVMYITFNDIDNILTGVYFVKILLVLITSLPIICFVYSLNHIFNGIVLPITISVMLAFGNAFVGVVGKFLSDLYFYSYMIFSLYEGYNNILLIAMSLLFSLLFITLGYLLLEKNLNYGRL